MSILIHGIEMPKDGCGFLMAFTLNEKGEWLCANMNECKWRTVEVLPPHGRLIDADELIYKLGVSDEDIYARDYLEDAPTVVESEE